MISFLKHQKNRIKSEPIILLKRPWLVFLIPPILVHIVYNRMKNTETVVFLTETRLDKFPEVNNREATEIFRYGIITDAAGFSSLAKRRIEEDPEMSEVFYKTVINRFGRGDFAVVSTDKENNPLSYVFICTGQAEFTPVGMNLRLPGKTFGMYDVYTFMESRSKGYYAGLFYYTVDMMKDRGCEKMWLWLMEHNTVSVGVHYKLGISNISKILTERMKIGLKSHTVKDVEMSLTELMPHE